MKKKISITLVVLLITLFISQSAYANMARPNRTDIASTITFEKSEELGVLSEVLNITVNGASAEILATYTMKNTTEESVGTQAMFLSPNIKNSGVKVTANGKELSFTVKSYALNYATEIETEDWKYAVLTDEGIASDTNEQTVDAISFEMNFEPNEEYDVVIAYNYSLGGRPNDSTDVKHGEIEYYLTPAAMWKDFGGITINLFLDENMPAISKSNLKFKKIEERSYQYISNTLPSANLELIIDEGPWQNFLSALNNPYYLVIVVFLLPFALIAYIIIVIIALAVITRYNTKKEKSDKLQDSSSLPPQNDRK